MGIQEYRATGGNKALLKEYHRKSDSLAQCQINFSQYDAQTYVFDHIGSCNPVAGYMPRYYPYGFIYPGASNRTIAHELGHGIAGLEHPFPESQVSGSTQNLMDYRDGEELWHFQWDILEWVIGKCFELHGQDISVYPDPYLAYISESFDTKDKIIDYAFALAQSGVSNMFSYAEADYAKTFLIKFFTDCFSFQHHWSSKLYDSAFENQDWEWLQTDFLNCVINVIIGGLFSGDLIKSPYFNFLIGTVSNIAQDEVANILGDWFKVKRDRDYYNNNSLDK